MAAQGKKLMDDLDFKGNSFAPMNFWTALREYYPVFDERDEKTRGFKQHDADECYTVILNSWR